MRVMKRSKLKRPEFVQKRRRYEVARHTQRPPFHPLDNPVQFGILAFIGSMLVIVVLSTLIIY